MSGLPVDSAQQSGASCFSCQAEVAARIATLYGDERLADVTFVVKRDEGSPSRRFVGHRNIISTWSRPLDRMLCGSFAEGSSHEVQIQDVEPAAFETMLKMMYCGTAEITVDNVLAILDASVRFDVAPLVQFSVQFLQSHISSEHACWMLGVGVQYGLVKLVDRCIELIVTDDHILESDDFMRLSQAAVVELARHDAWNIHEDHVFDALARWASRSASSADEQHQLLSPILEHLRYPVMSVEKLRALAASNEVPHHLLFEALFFKLEPGAQSQPDASSRTRQRSGSLLFGWVPTSKVTVSGDRRESALHSTSNGFTGVRGDRRMQHGIYTWTIDIVETQSAWIFTGVAQADDPCDVAWRSTGRMLYCLDSRYFHQGSGQNHPGGDRKVCSGDAIKVVLDCTHHTLAFGINNEKPQVLFKDLPPVAYVPAVDLRDCGDKVRLLPAQQPQQLGSARTAPGGAAAGPPRGTGQSQPAQGGALGSAQGGSPSVGRMEDSFGVASVGLLGAPAHQAPPMGSGVPAPRERRSEPAGGRLESAADLAGVAPEFPAEPATLRRGTVGGEAHTLQPAAHGQALSGAHSGASASGDRGAPATGDRGSAGSGHPHATSSWNDARRLQPRQSQSQGPQSGAPQASVSSTVATLAMLGPAPALAPPTPPPLLPEDPGGRDAAGVWEPSSGSSDVPQVADAGARSSEDGSDVPPPG